LTKTYFCATILAEVIEMTNKKETDQDITRYSTFSRGYRLFLAFLVGVCVVGLITIGATMYMYLTTNPEAMGDKIIKLSGIIMITAAVGMGLYAIFIFYINKSTRLIYTY
jgi:hypothetical protein